MVAFLRAGGICPRPKGECGAVLKVPPLLSDDKALFLSGYSANGMAGSKKCADPTRFKRCSLWCWSCGIVDNRLSRLLGAEDIFVVDHHPYRLRFAADRYGAIPINFDEDSDPAQSIIEQTAGHRGVDAEIDAVGFEAKGSTTETVLTNLKLEGSSGKALRQCIAAVRRGGIVSVPGVYAGFIHGFLFGDAFDKGLTFKMGQTTFTHGWENYYR